MKGLFITAFGAIDDALVEEAASCTRRHLGVVPERLPPIEEPPGAFDPGRGQYSAVEFLRAVVSHPRPRAGKVFAVTERDLFIPMLTFLFGQAQLSGPAALVSVARLRQEFYGLPADRELLLARLRAETLHETGHAFGLIHCRDRRCSMSLATSIQQLDMKQDDYCLSCRRALDEILERFFLETK